MRHACVNIQDLLSGPGLAGIVHWLAYLGLVLVRTNNVHIAFCNLCRNKVAAAMDGDSPKAFRLTRVLTIADAVTNFLI